MKLASMLCAMGIALVVPSGARGLQSPLYEPPGAALRPPLLDTQRGAVASPPAGAMAPQSAAALSAFLERAVTRGDVPGVVALVVGPDGVLYHEAFGKLNVARNVNMRPDAIFRIASMTKPITSVAALMLMDEGTLQLDDRVDAYLPAFRSRQVITAFDEAAGTYATRPATTPITIRHLMTHTSGIGYAWSQPPIALAKEEQGCWRRSCLSSTSPVSGGPTARAHACSATSSRRFRDKASTSSCARESSSRSACARRRTTCRRRSTLAW